MNTNSPKATADRRVFSNTFLNVMGGLTGFRRQQYGIRRERGQQQQTSRGSQQGDSSRIPWSESQTHRENISVLIPMIITCLRVSSSLAHSDVVFPKDGLITDSNRRFLRLLTRGWECRFVSRFQAWHRIASPKEELFLQAMSGASHKHSSQGGLTSMTNVRNLWS